MTNTHPTAPMPRLIGHRGLPSRAPENTKASIELAATNDISWVEIDVTMAGDGSLVIMHDTTLKRFGVVDTSLKDLDYKDLKRVDAGSWFSADFKAEPLLFLDDLLLLVNQLNLGLNLEIKINPDLNREQQVRRIYSALECGSLKNERLIISSFDLTALSQLRSFDNSLNIAVLFEKVPDTFFKIVEPINPISIHCHQGFLTKEQAQIVTANFPLYCYTVNDAATLKKLLAWQVSGVFSDQADAQDLRSVPAQI